MLCNATNEQCCILIIHSVRGTNITCGDSRFSLEPAIRVLASLLTIF